MPPPLRAKRTEGIHRRHRVAMLCMASLVTALLHTSHAQTIYRCGSDYSPSAACEQASTVQAPATAQPATQPSLQKQADALEKQRLQNERALTQSAVPVTPHLATLSATQPTEVQPMPRAHKKHSKVQSPYFTAYGAAPAKPSKKAASAP